jgi:hypothetical protein
LFSTTYGQLGICCFWSVLLLGAILYGRSKTTRYFEHSCSKSIEAIILGSSPNFNGPSGPRLDYNIFFHNAATYAVWVRGMQYGFGNPAESTTLDFGINGQCVTCGTSDIPISNNWDWQMASLTATFEAGAATLNIWKKGTGVIMIDQIYLSANLTETQPPGRRCKCCSHSVSGFGIQCLFQSDLLLSTIIYSTKDKQLE